ncbi:MAG: hypothetical protein LBB19_00015 [Puniceicoccales bacterium]|jgi:hypothetical protein|nr:hypothetical protein [Puniceicoccales bacterium]
MSFSNLPAVGNYTYPTAVSPDTGKSIPQTKPLRTICNDYKSLFRNQYTAIANKLLQELNGILGLTGGNALSVSMNDTTFNVTMPTTWPNASLGDRVCQEGNKAYKYYLQEVVGDLKTFCEYIEAAGKTFKELGELRGNIDDQAHVLLDKLQCYDQLCGEMVKEFSKHFKYNMDSDTWEEACDAIGSSSPYNLNSQLTGTYTSLDALRKINVTCINSSGPTSKEINTFNELSKLDKLKFIRLYYNLILNNNQPQTVFPDDLKTGYPCLPNEVSTSGTEDTKELGALELFYIGYLIDRDGPINALSSFLEIKTQALRKNISLMMDKIEALNQCLTFINRGLDLLNASQSGGEKKNRIPDAAHVALVLFCDGVVRGLKELTINGKKERYFVLQSSTTTANGYSLTESGKYLLVKADTTGLNALLGTSITGNGNSATSNGCEHRISFVCENSPEANTSDSNVIESSSAYTIYNGFSWTGYFSYGIRDCKNLGTILLANFSSWNSDVVKDWLPKEISVDRVLRDSVLGYNGSWVQSGSVDANMASSWTTAFTNKSEYINTAIESINNDVSTMRTKIDTFDSASSTFRNRAHDTYSGIVGRIGG